MAYAKASGGALDLYVSNNAQAKKIRAVWTAYDANGDMSDMTEKVIDMGANEYKKLSIPAGWQGEAASSSVFLWEADTLVPLLPKTEIK